jgi:OmpA-OmpF porin, OOP family
MITVLMSILTVSVQAGPGEDPASKLPFSKKIRLADNLYQVGSFSTAREYYLQLKKEQPRNPYLAWMIAECAALERDYPPAADFYAEAFSLAPDLYKEAPFKEGTMRKMNGDYVKAIERFTYYKNTYKGKDRKRKLDAQREIDGCNMAINSLNDPGRAYIKNAGPNINTVYTELSPMPLGDTALLFSTMNQNKLGEAGKDKKEDYMARFKWSPKEFDRTRVKDSFEVAMKFEDGKYNDRFFHVGNGSWSPGGTRFYFTKCLEKDSFKIECKIWVASFDSKMGQWSSPKTIEAESEINLAESVNTNPHCAMIGKKEVLFFSSNRKLNSVGGYDIWYSVYDSARKSYRRPQNCGKKVNSRGDEKTPFYDTRKGVLYYSSNGLVNIGGFDIYSAKGGPTRWSEVYNLGVPINSPADDLYYVPDPGKKDNAYIVSNRLGTLYGKNPTCCDDIWRVIKEPNFYVKGALVDEETNELIGKTVVKMKDEGATLGGLDTLYSKEGNFMFSTLMGKNYSLSAEKDGYLSGRTTLSTTNKSVMEPDDTTEVTIYMRKINAQTEFHVQNVYYNFNKGEFQPQPQSYAALDSMVKFLQDNPAVSVEIRSYTDAIGDDESNEDLSVRRAQTVKAYMISKGIDAGRMIARGEGKKNPKAPNAIGGVDNPDGRQLNRRTEFKIIGQIPNKNIIYDDNKPQFIDKTGTETRNKNLQVNTDISDDAPVEPEKKESN